MSHFKIKIQTIGPEILLPPYLLSEIKIPSKVTINSSNLPIYQNTPYFVKMKDGEGSFAVNILSEQCSCS